MTSADELSFLMVFLAGIVSFLSPCVLPLVPGYLSIITGNSFQELSDRTRSREKSTEKILLPTLLFIS